MPQYQATYRFERGIVKQARSVIVEADGLVQATRKARKAVMSEYGGPNQAYKLIRLAPIEQDEFSHLRFLLDATP